MATGPAPHPYCGRSYSDGAGQDPHTWTRSLSERMRNWGLGPLQVKLRAARKKKVQGECTTCTVLDEVKKGLVSIGTPTKSLRISRKRHAIFKMF